MSKDKSKEITITYERWELYWVLLVCGLVFFMIAVTDRCAEVLI